MFSGLCADESTAKFQQKVSEPPIHNCLVRGSIPRSLSNLQISDGREARIGGLLRLRFGLREDRFWPEADFGPFVSGPRNPVSPMQIDLGQFVRIRS